MRQTPKDHLENRCILKEGIKLPVQDLDLMAAILEGVQTAKRPLFGQDLVLSYLGEYGKPTSAKELHAFILNKDGPVITEAMTEKAFRSLQKWSFVKPAQRYGKQAGPYKSQYVLTNEGMVHYQTLKNSASI